MHLAQEMVLANSIPQSRASRKDNTLTIRD